MIWLTRCNSCSASSAQRRGLVVQRRMIAQQIKDVGDGGKRVVDFMGDDAGNAAHRRQLFRLAQRLFRLQLGGDVAADLEHRVAFMIHGLAAGDTQSPIRLSGLLRQIALPGLFARAEPCSISSRGTGKTVCRMV